MFPILLTKIVTGTLFVGQELFFADACTKGKPEIVETLKKLNFMVDNFIRRDEVLWFQTHIISK